MGGPIDVELGRAFGHRSGRELPAAVALFIERTQTSVIREAQIPTSPARLIVIEGGRKD